MILESLLINAATIKNELLDKSAGTSIFIGIRFFLPFIIISEEFPFFLFQYQHQMFQALSQYDLS